MVRRGVSEGHRCQAPQGFVGVLARYVDQNLPAGAASGPDSKRALFLTVQVSER